jgi:precorrin-2 dehydrogenase / sirohydrochlorin ferrochelatase
VTVYPVALLLAGRPVLVVGGGTVASQKVRGLLAGGADDVTVVAPRVADEIAAAGVRVERRSYRDGEAGRYRLVLTATDDPTVNQRVFDDAEAAGVWVNSADDPDRCAFHVPAVVRQGPVTLGISTGGASPALASWLRRRLEAELGPEYAELAQLLRERREALRSEGVPTEGLPWQEVLDAGVLDLVRAGRLDEARERLAACR